MLYFTSYDYWFTHLVWRYAGVKGLTIHLKLVTRLNDRRIGPHVRLRGSVAVNGELSICEELIGPIPNAHSQYLTTQLAQSRADWLVDVLTQRARLHGLSVVANLNWQETLT